MREEWERIKGEMDVKCFFFVEHLLPFRAQLVLWDVDNRETSFLTWIGEILRRKVRVNCKTIKIKLHHRRLELRGQAVIEFLYLQQITYRIHVPNEKSRSTNLVIWDELVAAETSIIWCRKKNLQKMNLNEWKGSGGEVDCFLFELKRSIDGNEDGVEKKQNDLWPMQSWNRSRIFEPKPTGRPCI